MGKYIRTKDAIYKVRKPALDEYLWEDSTYVYKHEHINNKDIIKRADTIEELIDKFVCGQTILRSKEDAFIATGIEIKIPTVYGAIWTTKGLIYVARMNDKGELELL